MAKNNNNNNQPRAPVPDANCHSIMQQRRNNVLESFEDRISGNLRSAGLYFDSYDSIWTIERETHFREGDLTFLNAIRREGGPGAMDPVDHFEDRFPKMRRAIYEANTRTTALPDLRLDIFGRTHPERAHSIPHTPGSCAAYGPLAEAAMGVRVRNSLQRAKLIRGTKRCGGERRSGLRYSQYNLLPLAQQGSFFDGLPYVMVIPCVDLQFALDWVPGLPYDCMVIAGGATVGNLGDAELIDAYRSLLGRTFLYCNEQEAANATNLLATFVRAGACCIKNEQSLGILDYVTNTAESARLRNLFDNHQEGIPVPSMTAGVNYQHRRLAKVCFPNQYIGDHIPDPFLLVIKAMVCFSASQNCKLMPYNFRPSHFDDTSEEGESEGELDSEEVELEESAEEGVGIDHVGCPPMLSRFMAAKADVSSGQT
jgi:hypothetical protein